MPEIGVRMDGGAIALWMDCDHIDALSASLDVLRDPVARALLVGRVYERAEWSQPGVLNLITKGVQGRSYWPSPSSVSVLDAPIADRAVPLLQAGPAD